MNALYGLMVAYVVVFECFVSRFHPRRRWVRNRLYICLLFGGFGLYLNLEPMDIIDVGKTCIYKPWR
jgi:hypothetical protein